MSRKGRAAAPGFQLHLENCLGRVAALSRHKAAPTGITQATKSMYPTLTDRVGSGGFCEVHHADRVAEAASE